MFLFTQRTFGNVAFVATKRHPGALVSPTANSVPPSRKTPYCRKQPLSTNSVDLFFDFSVNAIPSSESEGQGSLGFNLAKLR